VNTKGKFDIEDRLIRFSIVILEICELIPFTLASRNLVNQLTRCGVAPALLYGEAQAAESRADFIHKMRIALKELRETRVLLKIVYEKPVLRHAKIESALKECCELIAIFSTSITTATRNKVLKGKK